MKKIYIVRHAKSDWSNSFEIKDIDRSLNTRGVKDAYKMSSWCKEQSILPDLILSSNGVRALHTAIIFAHQIGFESRKIEVIEDLYHATPDVILNELSKLPESINTVMLFAHNPGIEELASFVNKDSYVKVPTCTLIDIEADISSWASLNVEQMSLIHIKTPKK